MKRLIIICEGETEYEFCKDVLYSYFIHQNILIEYKLIKKSNGGIVKWATLKTEIENYLKQDTDAHVTTLIDFYGLHSKHNFPSFGEITRTNQEKVEKIECGMKDAIDSALSYRFIPYIQIHEFECFIFCSLEVLKKNFKSTEANFEEIEKVIEQFPNVEDINNDPTTAPSKRLEKHIIGYNKPVFGACLTESIGLDTIRAKCPRFNNWIAQIEKI